ncbi:MAG: outer membrane protein assembly factor BamC, partial [Chromatiaceae bacterium]|nr:outer membrane protein assembly factor BamC [Chromatiaceae bacterium]
EVQLKRDGTARWLEVKASPTQTWNSVLAFWREQGIVLVEQDPAIGLMRTDWLDNRAEIRRDFVTRMISKVAEGLYATSTRDQYSLRLDKIAGGAATEIHLTHRGMEETLAENAVGGVSRTVWEPSGRDTEKEAEMLRRLMVYLGASRDEVQAVSAAPSTTASTPLARLDESAGTPVLLIEQSERRAWRLSGAALDRAGFTVEDRDQSAGLFFVRYAGDSEEVSGDERKGFASRLAFWRSKKSDGIDGVRQYRIQLEGDERATQVQVLDAEGRPAPSNEARRILGLIQQEMR